MSKFKLWYVTNQDAITWFLIGVLTAQCIDHLGRGEYGYATLSAGIALANYFLVNVRLKV